MTVYQYFTNYLRFYYLPTKLAWQYGIPGYLYVGHNTIQYRRQFFFSYGNWDRQKFNESLQMVIRREF